jgi:hypothetical protein
MSEIDAAPVMEEPVVEAAAAEEPSQEPAAVEPPQPKAKAKAKPRAKKPEPIIDALPAEAEPAPPPSPPELVREPSKRKKAAPEAQGLPEAPKAKRAKKVHLAHEVAMADTVEPPYAPPAITHTDLHSMFRQYMGNHKIMNQQAKRDMYRHWLAA